MRLVIFTPKYPSIANKHSFGFVHARVKLYKRRGYNVFVTVPEISSKYKNNYVNSYSYEDINVLRINYMYVNQLIESIDPDVIIYHFPNPIILGKIIKMDRPIVLWIHGSDILIKSFHEYFSPYLLSDIVGSFRSLLLDFPRNLWLRYLFLKRPDILYVFPSIWMKNMFIKYISPPKDLYNNMYIIPNPVDTNLFRPMNECNSRNRNIAITVRALYYVYGIDTAIRAFSNLKNVKLTIIGNGPLKDKLRELAVKTKSNIEFIFEGIPHSMLPVYYNNAGFFVAPSRSESQGVAMCEAMSAGLPVIATNVGGIPEFVKHGYNGILVPRNSHLLLRKAILTIINLSDDKYCSLAINAREYSLKKFSHHIIIPKEILVLRKAFESFYGGKD